MQESAALSPDVAIPLALTFVQAIARHTGARVLFFKGVPAQLQHLRTPRPSADVDILVHPADLPALTEALEQRGWRARRTPPDEIRIIPNHAITLVHATWPCDLDLQYFFPGIFAPPAQAFETLWANRATLTVAAQPITAPNPDAHRLLLAVNTLRDLGTPKADRDAASLAQHFTAHPEDWQRVLALAAPLRARATLREFALEHHLPAPASDLTTREQRQLVHLLKYKTGAVGNLRYLLTDPAISPRRKLHALRLQLVKSGAQLTAESSNFAGGMRATLRKNLQRVGTAATHLREARRRTVRIARERPAAPTGREFQPASPAPSLEFAQLDTRAGAVVLTNAPLSPLPTTTPSPATPRFQPGRLARAEHDGTLYVLSLSAEYLARNPQLTPPVLRLDPSGREVLELLTERPLTAAEVAQRIAQAHGVAAGEIEPGIAAYLAELARAGVVDAA